MGLPVRDSYARKLIRVAQRQHSPFVPDPIQPFILRLWCRRLRNHIDAFVARFHFHALPGRGYLVNEQVVAVSVGSGGHVEALHLLRYLDVLSRHAQRWDAR